MKIELTFEATTKNTDLDDITEDIIRMFETSLEIYENIQLIVDSKLIGIPVNNIPG